VRLASFLPSTAILPAAISRRAASILRDARSRRDAVPPRSAEEGREEAARRLLERLLAAATVSALLAGLVERANRPTPGTRLAPLPVDVAHDPPWRLSLLPGIGRVRAEALVRDREANGPVASLDDLDRVPGIGRKTIAALTTAGAVVGGRTASAASRPPTVAVVRSPPDE
jgi:predicted flap endonuclease-1-like 5' DNA nuclease